MPSCLCSQLPPCGTKATYAGEPGKVIRRRDLPGCFLGVTWLSSHHGKRWPCDRSTSDQGSGRPSLAFSLMMSPSLPNSFFLGFHFNSIPKPTSLSQPPMHSTLPSFVPFSPSGPPLLGCCETPMVSLAEAQQELQMLQKQLGESEHRCCLGVLMGESEHRCCLGVLMGGGPTRGCSAWLWLDGGQGEKKTRHGSQADGGKACLLLVCNASAFVSGVCTSATGGMQRPGTHGLLTELAQDSMFSVYPW